MRGTVGRGGGKSIEGWGEIRIGKKRKCQGELVV